MKVRNIAELRTFAAEFVRRLVPNGHGATVVVLSGELGAGKTAFVQAVANDLGIGENVTSPTFVIEKIYDLKEQKFKRLIHIDAYRLESPRELEALGFRELLEDIGNLILLEWPERVPELIPKKAIRIRFDIRGDERIITLDGEEKS